MAKYKLPKIEKAESVCEEVAIDEFMRMAERWKIKTDLLESDDEQELDDDERAHVKAVELVIDQIRYGVISIDDDELTPIVTAKTDEDKEVVIKFKKPGGELRAMDMKKKGQDIGKLWAVIAQWGGIPPVTYGKLVPFYKNVCQALFMLFFFH
jgi:hypothetical protein